MCKHFCLAVGPADGAREKSFVLFAKHLLIPERSTSGNEFETRGHRTQHFPCATRLLDSKINSLGRRGSPRPVPRGFRVIVSLLMALMHSVEWLFRWPTPCTLSHVARRKPHSQRNKSQAGFHREWYLSPAPRPSGQASSKFAGRFYRVTLSNERGTKPRWSWIWRK